MRERALDGCDALGADAVLHELVLRHELQHTETMRQAMALGGPAAGRRAAGTRRVDGAGRAGRRSPAGAFEIGAGADGFAYDNERPRHARRGAGVPRSRRTPITNATWLHFGEGGGYERREWWSRRGLGVEGGVRHHPPRRPRRRATRTRPSCHVSWFEADAFARAHGARLPTEAEWEKAATWGQLDERTGRGLGVDRQPRSRGYPGFVAHPYREYSEVFFGDGYRVLRGGSWATHPRVADADVPQLGPAPAPADLRGGAGSR